MLRKGVLGSMEVYVLVRTVTYAQTVMKLLNSRGILCKQAKSPRELGKNGCGYAVIAKNASPELILNSVSDVGLPNFRVYLTADGKSFQQLR